MKKKKDVFLLEISEEINIPESYFKAARETFCAIDTLDKREYILSQNKLKKSIVTVKFSCSSNGSTKVLHEVYADLNCYKNLLENLAFEGEKKNEWK